LNRIAAALRDAAPRIATHRNDYAQQFLTPPLRSAALRTASHRVATIMFRNFSTPRPAPHHPAPHRHANATQRKEHVNDRNDF
jgi:hypothetical protein